MNAKVRYLAPLVVGISLAVSSWLHADTLYVDHTAVEAFETIPDVWLNKVKTLLVHYVGASHGRQLPYGLEMLEALDPKYSVQLDEDLATLTETGALRVLRAQRSPYSDWIGSISDEKYWATPDGKTWTTRTIQYALAQQDTIFLSLWCWSWHMVFDWTEDESGTLGIFDDVRRDNYLNALTAFNNDPALSPTIFAYGSTVTDTNIDETAWRTTHYNDEFRALCPAGGVFFDQGDIENWNYDDTEQRIETWDGHDLYMRHHDYDAATPPNDNPVDDHANDLIGLRKAKAFWWMLARLAGWDGVAGKALDLTSVPDSTTLYGNTVYTLSWTQANISTLRIYYSTDTGATWHLAADGINASSDSYDWTVPELYSENCLVRITDCTDESITDQTAQVFTISPGGRWGDVDGDDSVDIVDAYAIATYDIDQENCSLWPYLTRILHCGDVSCDDAVDITDALICATYELYPGGAYPLDKIGSFIPSTGKMAVTDQLDADNAVKPGLSVQYGEENQRTVTASVGGDAVIRIGAASIIVRWDVAYSTYRGIDTSGGNFVVNSSNTSSGEIRLAGFDVSGKETFDFPVITFEHTPGQTKEWYSMEIVTVAEAHTFQKIPIDPDDMIIVGVSDEDAVAPEALVLHKNCPNPFNASTSISFDTFIPGIVTLDIYTLQGQKVRRLFQGPLPAGRHSQQWNGTDDHGRNSGTGTYLYTVTHGGISYHDRMLLIR